MKHIMLLLLLTSVCQPLFSAENSTFSCDRCDIGKIYYNIATVFGRNDYLYLACTNAAWFLKKKLQLKESYADRDRYHFFKDIWYCGQRIAEFGTPLHAAIKHGNIRVVKLLCAAGADINKKIKNVDNINQNELTNEQYTRFVGAVNYYDGDASQDKVQERIEDFKANSYVDVGKTAVELALSLAKAPKDKLQERKRVAKFLQGLFAKNDSL